MLLEHLEAPLQPFLVQLQRGPGSHVPLPLRSALRLYVTLAPWQVGVTHPNLRMTHEHCKAQLN